MYRDWQRQSGAVSHTRRSVQLMVSAIRHTIMGQLPTGTCRKQFGHGLTLRQERDVVVVVRNLMAMTVIGVHQVHDVFMGMTMFLNLGLMVRHDLGEGCQVVGHGAGICRQHDADRKSGDKYAF